MGINRINANAKEIATSKQFNKRVSRLHSNMVHRFKEKRSKRTGRISRTGRLVTFSSSQLKDWLLARFGGEHGVISCRYCDLHIDAFNCTLDHVIPIKRGGTLGLDNLDAICHPCNQRKGGLKPDEFTVLLNGLQSFPEAAKTDILHRLEIAVQLAASQRRFLSLRPSEAAQPLPPTTEGEETP